jgi:magnesium transporter
MLFAYACDDRKLQQLPLGANLTAAVWIDLYRPQPPQTALVRALGVDIPTLADMEEIEVSNRLYREKGVDYLTVVLPGLSDTKTPLSGPVCFMLQPDRLITVRHHAPRPFETYPARAEKVGLGGGGADPRRVFLSLMEEIIGRLADLLEGSGRALDAVTAQVFLKGANTTDTSLQDALRDVARESELLSRVRLSLLTIERAISYFGQSLGTTSDELRPMVKGLMRDIQALEVHGDFLTSRVAMATDVTLGMVNLAQNKTVKIVSVVAVIFLPPTVIASAYGMNFAHMPELGMRWGYPMALGLMLASAIGTYLFFKWKHWL